jgi:hypothetical protein
MVRPGPDFYSEIHRLSPLNHPDPHRPTTAIHTQDRSMNTSLRTRITRAAAALTAAALMTFSGLGLIAHYALPGDSGAASVQLARASIPAPR